MFGLLHRGHPVSARRTVEYKNLLEQPIEVVLSQVRNSSHADSVTSVAALTARCTVEVAGRLENVWGGLHDVNVVLHGLKEALSQAATESAKHTAALVTWTKVLAVTTGILAFATVGLVVVAIIFRGH